MLKVENGSCSVPTEFQDEIFGCFGSYTASIEDRHDQFPSSIYANASDLRYTDNVNDSAWRYKSQKDLGGLPLRLVNTDITYSGGGFVQVLPVEHNDAAATLEELKAGRWITEGTRVLFLDFTVYNANINLFCVVKYIFEFPASGGVVSSSQFRSMKLIRYVDAYDYFVLACEVVFVLFVLYYTVEEILELRKLGLYKYLTSSVWQVLDLVILVCSYVSILFYAYRTVLIDNTLDDLIEDDATYANFEHVAYWQTEFNFLIALTLFLSWIKAFKYLSFNRTMYQMSETLSKCAKDIMGYTVMFLIVFFAFAQLGYLVFSSNTFGFHTFGDTIFTLFRIILGDFDFYALQQSHPVFGPIYFVTYVFVVFFILVNVFLAIINDSYINVKEQSREEELNGSGKQFIVAELVLEQVRSFFRLKKKSKNKIGVIGETDTTTTADTIEEGRRKTRPSTARSQSKLRNERKASTSSRAHASIDDEEIARLNRRVDRLEEAMGSTIAKIDAILVHLENIEYAQRKAAGFEDDDDMDGSDLNV